ncbi:MAG TPA: hypothetical protein VJA23_06010 [Candidatus Nanoarchaeia archaeon]|nr:hypothetical protein [Candidatus Nanoarchaeia archaeon]
MSKKIVFRAVIEVLGKPPEHVDQSLKEYVENIKKNKDYEVSKEKYAPIQKQEKQELWSNFAELEIKTGKVEHLTSFCFEYMPSMIEVLEPEEISWTEQEFSVFLNDLQSRLHQIDLIAKQVKAENDQLKRNQASLLRNYIVVLLSHNNLTSEQLSQLMGVNKDKLEDYLDLLIDEGKIGLKEKIYFIKKEGARNS